MFILDSLLVGGLRFVLDKLLIVADHEAHDDTALRERLLEAQMQRELGELTDAEFAEIERDIFDRLREMRDSGAPDTSLQSGKVKVTGVEASVADEIE